MATLTAWRLVKPAYANSAYDGEGSRRFGGRWNPPGFAVAYAAESRALAALELLVHVKDLRLIKAYMLVPCRFDTGLVETLEMSRLAPGWNERATSAVAQDTGARWLEETRSAVLAVPSVVIPAERNYLVNPAHPRVHECEAGRPEPFDFDPRLA